MAFVFLSTWCGILNAVRLGEVFHNDLYDLMRDRFCNELLVTDHSLRHRFISRFGRFRYLRFLGGSGVAF
jgi:hypothetical protein